MKFQWILVYVTREGFIDCRPFKRYHEMRAWMNENSIRYDAFLNDFRSAIYFKRKVPA